MNTGKGGAVPKQIDRGPAGDEDAGKVGQGLGGATGAAAGAGLGALFGPAGIIVGGLAGAVGGWWAGREITNAADDFSDETDEHYRRLHSEWYADRAEFDEARGYYRLGHVARRNPGYAGRSFADIEDELRRGWKEDAEGRFRTWDDVRPFISAGYDEAPR
jgi:hypothetical protein